MSLSRLVTVLVEYWSRGTREGVEGRVLMFVGIACREDKDMARREGVLSQDTTVEDLERES